MISSTEVVEAYDAWLKAEALEDSKYFCGSAKGPCFLGGLARHFQTADLFEIQDYVLRNIIACVYIYICIHVCV